MFDVTNATGERQARYEHLSEALTYFKMSTPGNEPKFDGKAQKGEIRVFDQTNAEVGSILLPRDWHPTADEQKELERYKAEMPE